MLQGEHPGLLEEPYVIGIIDDSRRVGPVAGEVFVNFRDKSQFVQYLRWMMKCRKEGREGGRF